MLAQFVEVAVWCLEIEPSMTVGTVLHISQAVDTCGGQLSMRSNDVVNPESRDRTCIKVIVFSRVRSEDLEEVTILSRKPREARYIGRHRHPELLREKGRGCRAILSRRADPDDPLNVHSASSKRTAAVVKF